VPEQKPPIELDGRTHSTALAAPTQETQAALMDTAPNCSSGTKACGSSCISIEKTCYINTSRLRRGVACGKSYIAAGKVCHEGSLHKKRKKTSTGVAKLKIKE
jgi:hypothetical protein